MCITYKVSYGTTNNRKYVYDELIDFISGNSNSPDKNSRMQLALAGSLSNIHAYANQDCLHVIHSLVRDFQETKGDSYLSVFEIFNFKNPKKLSLGW